MFVWNWLLLGRSLFEIWPEDRVFLVQFSLPIVLSKFLFEVVYKQKEVFVQSNWEVKVEYIFNSKFLNLLFWLSACFMVKFDNHSLDSWLEEVQLLIEVVQLKRKLNISCLKARHLSFLLYFQPFEFKTKHRYAVSCVFTLTCEVES